MILHILRGFAAAVIGAVSALLTPPNRLVTFLTPILFAPLAGALTGWLALNFPGLPHLDPTQVLAAEGAGATAAILLASQWLRGWHLKMELDADKELATPNKASSRAKK